MNMDTDELLLQSYLVATTQLGTYDPVRVKFFGTGLNLVNGIESDEDYDDMPVHGHLPLWHIIYNYTANINVTVLDKETFIRLTRDLVSLIDLNRDRGIKINRRAESKPIHEYSGVMLADAQAMYRYLLNNNKYAITDHFHEKSKSGGFSGHRGVSLGGEEKIDIDIDKLYNQAVSPTDTIRDGDFSTIKKVQPRIDRLRRKKIKGWNPNERNS